MCRVGGRCHVPDIRRDEGSPATRDATSPPRGVGTPWDSSLGFASTDVAMPWDSSLGFAGTGAGAPWDPSLALLAQDDTRGCHLGRNPARPRAHPERSEGKGSPGTCDVGGKPYDCRVADREPWPRAFPRSHVVQSGSQLHQFEIPGIHDVWRRHHLLRSDPATHLEHKGSTQNQRREPAHGWTAARVRSRCLRTHTPRIVSCFCLVTPGIAPPSRTRNPVAARS